MAVLHSHRTQHAYLKGVVCFSDIIIVRVMSSKSYNPTVHKEMWRWTDVHLGTEILV